MNSGNKVHANNEHHNNGGLKLKGKKESEKEKETNNITKGKYDDRTKDKYDDRRLATEGS